MISRRHFRALNRPFSTANKIYSGNGTLAIVRECYGMWERRAPLTPDHVDDLVNQGFKVLIQPCSRRIFKDVEYQLRGGIITENIESATVIIGVKKMPAQITSGKSYMFFSHVIKAQPTNMPMLDQFLSTNARLFDYECITKGGLIDITAYKLGSKFIRHSFQIRRSR